jgi:hypothetical protein
MPDQSSKDGLLACITLLAGAGGWYLDKVNSKRKRKSRERRMDLFFAQDDDEDAVEDVEEDEADTVWNGRFLEEIEQDALLPSRREGADSNRCFRCNPLSDAAPASSGRSSSVTALCEKPKAQPRCLARPSVVSRPIPMPIVAPFRKTAGWSCTFSLLLGLTCFLWLSNVLRRPGQDSPTGA